MVTVPTKLGDKLQWDGEKQRFIGDDHANRLLGQPQRHPYHLLTGSTARTAQWTAAYQ